MSDPRDEYITQVVRGKTFAEVGGLWGTENEKVSVAHRAGARTLTMVDVTPPGHELWQLFEERRKMLRIPEVACYSGDVQTLVASSPELGFDVVHCSGVLYHVPNPLYFLRTLRTITREYLILSSSVTAQSIQNSHGRLDLPAAGVLFVPALQGREREILKAYWEQFVGDGAIGLTCDASDWQVDDFGPWWWLPTMDALKALCRAAGFIHQRSALMWNDNALVQLLAVRP
ncbi:MAG: hypothetical protein AB7G75_19460 [Candidatus Binatia bacterium]